MQATLQTANVAKREPEAVQRFEAGLNDYTRAALEMARALRTIDESAAFVFESCSSIGEWAERRRLSAAAARTLRDLAVAFEALPDFEEKVRSHKMTIEAAAALGQIAGHVERDQDWRRYAEEASTREVVQAVRKCQAEEAAKQRTYGVTFFLAHQDIVNFRKARKQICRSNGRKYSYEAAFNFLVGFYLDEKDPDRVKEGPRRMEDTTGATEGTWPASVARGILTRNDGKCLVTLCDNDIFTQRAHERAKRKGGGFEKGLPLCDPHHQDYDAKRIKNVGTPEEPILVDLNGTRIGGYLKRPRPPESDASARESSESGPTKSGPGNSEPPDTDSRKGKPFG